MRRGFVAAVALGAGLALAAPRPDDATETESQRLRARNIVDQIHDEYDFVVVGGGLAGLVLGARLSEDSNHTVLVLEAGSTGDEFRTQIDTPSMAYQDSLWFTPVDWQFKTTPQPGAKNNELVIPRGKTLGGSSAINGLYMTRPSEVELDAWNDLLGDMDGADNWTWDSFLAALKKSETFNPPTDPNIQKEAAITWTAGSHGTNGPIHYAYPGYTFPEVGYFSTVAQTVGIGTTNDAYGGRNLGAYVSTSCINPANWTRSYSKSGYLDPLPPRANYDVLTNAHVTRILFNTSSPAGNLTATAVEYAQDGGDARLTVKVNKEVILAGGSYGSPAVLLYSGVGPKDVLSAAGVPLVHELPGVGQHLQDHLVVSVQWNTDQPTDGSLYNNTGEKSDPKFMSYVNDAIVYVDAAFLFGNDASQLSSSIAGWVDQYTPDTGLDDAGITAYKNIYQTTLNKYFNGAVGQIELLFANNPDGAIRVTAAIQHPYSHGQVSINSSNPLDNPVINPNYLSNPADVQIMREGLKLARRFGQTEPLASSLQEETWPGPDVQSDADWEDWLRGQVSTEFHPSSTCAMLPQDQGGVVDAYLRVYGLANVRVADASVPPTSFASHLMGSTYGIAEQASTIIRTYHNIKPVNSTLSSKNNTQSSTTSGNKSASATDSGASSTSTAKGHKNGSDPVAPLHAWTFLVGLGAWVAANIVL